MRAHVLALTRPSVAALTLALVLQACSPDGSGSDDSTGASGGASLSGEWALSGGVTGASLTEVELTIEGDTAVSGFSGCNRFFGSVSLSKDTVSFGPLATTRRACEPAAMELEDRVLVSFGNVAGYRTTDSTLVLIDKGGAELLVWTRVPGLP